MTTPFKPARIDLTDTVADLKRRIRALEAIYPVTCPDWVDLTPGLSLTNGISQPSAPTSDQADNSCQVANVDVSTQFRFGELIVKIGTDPGSGTESCNYAIGGFNPGLVSQVIGYGRCYQAQVGSIIATIVYPALLLGDGSVQIVGVDDTGGGTTPTLARPDFPFVFAEHDTLFEGHYEYWEPGVL